MKNCDFFFQYVAVASIINLQVAFNSFMGGYLLSIIFFYASSGLGVQCFYTMITDCPLQRHVLWLPSSTTKPYHLQRSISSLDTSKQTEWTLSALQSTHLCSKFCHGFLISCCCCWYSRWLQGWLGISTVEVYGRFPHFYHLENAILLGHLHGSRYVSCARNAFGALATQGRALAGSSALDCETQLFGHFRA